jgi:ligand-binding SRPBCC domain-containing protein
MGESVTWRAKHFGIRQKLTSKITEFNRPFHFTDVMVQGAFKSFRHEHYFTELNGETLMCDIFLFEAPFGLIGKVTGWLVLSRYMIHLLNKRNAVIKEVAEGDRWPELLMAE